jgi:NTE family protein
MAASQFNFALVLSGGGARAAYQVGFLRALARQFPDLSPHIITGVSAGAVNAAYVANHFGTFAEKIEELRHIWAHLRIDDVYRVDSQHLARNVLRWGVRLTSGGSPGAPTPRSLVDTQPFRDLLTRALNTSEDGVLAGVDKNLRGGRLKALAITTSSYTTGQSVTWVQGDAIAEWDRSHRKSSACVLTVDHVMASAALPLFFPAVKLGTAWYGDGGIRLTAPLSPAVHLGADRILAITTRYGRSRQEADQPVIDGYPPPAQVGGVLMNAIFLDQLDGDALRLDRLNRLIAELPPEKRQGLRPINLLVLRPSRDLGKLANQYEVQLPSALRFLLRGLGTRETRSNDMLSLIMFQSDYLNDLLELGESDAEEYTIQISQLLGLEKGVRKREPNAI